MDNIELAQQLLAEYHHATNEELVEEVVYNNNLNERGLIEFEILWYEGLRTGSNLMWVQQEECIYYINGKSIKFNALAYTCIDERCTARILLLRDGTAAKEIDSPKHLPHGILYALYKERCLYTWMKHRSRTAPASVVIRNIYEEAVLE